MQRAVILLILITFDLISFFVTFLELLLLQREVSNAVIRESRSLSHTLAFTRLDRVLII